MPRFLWTPARHKTCTKILDQPWVGLWSWYCFSVDQRYYRTVTDNQLKRIIMIINYWLLFPSSKISKIKHKLQYHCKLTFFSFFLINIYHYILAYHYTIKIDLRALKISFWHPFKGYSNSSRKKNYQALKICRWLKLGSFELTRVLEY